MMLNHSNALSLDHVMSCLPAQTLIDQMLWHLIMSGQPAQTVIDRMLWLMQGCTAISLAEHSNCANISDMLRNAHPITHDIDSARSCSVDHIAARDADGAVGSLSRLSSMGSLLE